MLRKKKPACFLNQTFPLDSQLFPSILKYSALGLKALSIPMLHSLGILWEYLKGRSVSVQVLICLTAGELLLYLEGQDHKQEATV